MEYLIAGKIAMSNALHCRVYFPIKRILIPFRLYMVVLFKYAGKMAQIGKTNPVAYLGNRVIP